MLTADVKKRLTQLLGMLGSNYDGEVLNAGRLAQQIITNHKLQWEEVINSSANADLFGAANRAAEEAVRQQKYQEGFKVGLAQGRAEEASTYQRGFDAGVKSVSLNGFRANRSWREWANDRVANDADMLSDWEIKFFGSFGAGRYAVPSPKQKDIFERVSLRLEIELPE